MAPISSHLSTYYVYLLKGKRLPEVKLLKLFKSGIAANLTILTDFHAKVVIYSFWGLTPCKCGFKLRKAKLMILNFIH